MPTDFANSIDLEFKYEDPEFYVTDEVRHAYDERGFIIVRGLMDSGEIGKINTSLEEYGLVEKYFYGVTIAYETWGRLKDDRTNAVLLCHTLTSSSHARSHEGDPKEGWYEKFVGPGRALDTDEFYVICPNTLGGCYGTSGPSSINPETGQPYGSSFPVLSIDDMVHAQFLLVDHLGIDKLHACVGSSLGGLCSLMVAALYPARVGSDTSSIAMTYLQRKCIMSDPDWQNGHYYGNTYPKMGTKLAWEIATLTFRHGQEWDLRFGLQKITPTAQPTLHASFEIERYLEYQSDKFITKFDPNSLLYFYKAMELFDMAEGYSDIYEGVSRVKCPVLVMGVKTDIIYPIERQRELAEILTKSGNPAVTFYELNSIYGHDTCLLDVNGIGGAIKGFLQTTLSEHGWATKHKHEDIHLDRGLSGRTGSRHHQQL